MTHYAFTGSRKNDYQKLTNWGIRFVRHTIAQYVGEDNYWHVGDCDGVDSVIQFWTLKQAPAQWQRTKVYEVKPTGCDKRGKAMPTPYDFAQRTKRMIRALPNDGILVAFPARPCPDGCTPSYPDGHGSGTWLACAYAVRQGHQVIVYPFQSDMTLPLWITEQYLQLNLFD